MEATIITSHFDEAWQRTSPDGNGRTATNGNDDGNGIRLTWGVWSRWHARNKDRGRLSKDLLAPRLWRQDRGGTIHE